MGNHLWTLEKLSLSAQPEGRVEEAPTSQHTVRNPEIIHPSPGSNCLGEPQELKEIAVSSKLGDSQEYFSPCEVMFSYYLKFELEWLHLFEYYTIAE